MFFDPLPESAWALAGEAEVDDDQPMMASYGGLRCRFGRFGETVAVYLNETHVKCMTPSVPDDPADIYRETVTFSVAMNGYDFMEDSSELEFTFIGTGSPFKLGGLVILILLCAPLIAGCVVYSNQLFAGAFPI